MTSSKAAWLAALVALPPLVLGTVVLSHPAPVSEPVPAVAAYNEPPADTSRTKAQGLAQLFAALHIEDARGR